MRRYVSLAALALALLVGAPGADAQDFRGAITGRVTDPQGGRVGLGALLVGYYDGDDLVFAGKVGTGFNEKVLANLHRRMIARRSAKSPFSALPTKRSRWGTTFTGLPARPARRRSTGRSSRQGRTAGSSIR